MPIAIFTLGIGVFCLNTTEIMVSGLLPSLSAEFDVSVSTVGYLISIFALGMVIGGPLLTVALLRVPRKKALICLLLVFVLGQALGAVAPEFWVLVIARVVTALAASAFFGIAVAVSAQLVGPELRGRALSILLGGVMIAQVVGLPAASLIDQHFGWRASFWAVGAVAGLSAVAVAWLVPVTPLPERIDVRGEVAALRNPRLWAVYCTNAMVIGSIVAGTSYFSPIFVDVGGFSPSAVPWLFAVFGIGTVVGNAIIGRFVDRYMMPLIFYGLIGVTLCLVVFALVAHHRVATVVVLVVLGLIGLPLNPAMGARVMRVANDGPLVSTVNASAINIGVVLGPWAGGVAISAGAGLVAALWIGACMAFIGLLSVAPAYAATRRTRLLGTAAVSAVPESNTGQTPPLNR
ncbi:MFS transporter [Streptomyces sp. NPDC024089]|uniref:MFS transporter n=1 Tax=Streptomyces sp. NPDC024089 TaxID=3154328 RepID=UPI0033DF1392